MHVLSGSDMQLEGVGWYTTCLLVQYKRFRCGFRLVFLTDVLVCWSLALCQLTHSSAASDSLTIASSRFRMAENEHVLQRLEGCLVHQLCCDPL
jgi:hypothetical protein